MMRHHRKLLVHAVAWVASLLILAQPHRLWSSPTPVLDDTPSARLLSVVGSPASAALDERFAEEVTGRIYALRGYRYSSGEVAKGDNLAAVLQRAGAPATESAAFCSALRPVFDPRRAGVGDRYRVLVDPEGRLREFTYRVNPLEVYRAQAAREGWQISRVEIPTERREATIVGELSGSLYESFVAAGGDPELVMDFIELFRWDVDFAKEAQEGDGFRVVFENLYGGGEYAGHGRILAASYRDSEEEHVAIHFQEGGVEGYFDAKGENLKKAFLRSPLKFSRVSSGYTLARRHPILSVVRPHRGIDYAAPSGTPVWSVADGRVVEAGWKGGAGRSVTIRHAQGYESNYNHLSSIARGVRPGGRVEQGQIIGAVGSTGLSTGPHLDFRMKQGGQWVNPLLQKSIAGDPVPARLRGRYQAWAGQWLARLDAASSGIAVAQAGR